MVPAMGGAERKIRDTHWENRDFDQVFWYFGRLSWSPDGKLLAVSDRPSSNEPTSIYLLSLDSLSARRLTSPVFLATTTPYSRQMVKCWHSTVVHKESRASTPCLLREGRSDD
jgi:hypothetical protein